MTVVERVVQNCTKTNVHRQMLMIRTDWSVNRRKVKRSETDYHRNSTVNHLVRHVQRGAPSDQYAAAGDAVHRQITLTTRN